MDMEGSWHGSAAALQSRLDALRNVTTSPSPADRTPPSADEPVQPVKSSKSRTLEKRMQKYEKNLQEHHGNLVVGCTLPPIYSGVDGVGSGANHTTKVKDGEYVVEFPEHLKLLHQQLVINPLLRNIESGENHNPSLPLPPFPLFCLSLRRQTSEHPSPLLLNASFVPRRWKPPQARCRQLQCHYY